MDQEPAGLIRKGARHPGSDARAPRVSVGGRRQTAAGELGLKGLNPAVVRPPEDARRGRHRGTAAPRALAQRHTTNCRETPSMTHKEWSQCPTRRLALTRAAKVKGAHLARNHGRKALRRLSHLPCRKSINI